METKKTALIYVKAVFLMEYSTTQAYGVWKREGVKPERV